MSKTKYPLPPERGPYRLAIYDRDDEMVLVISQAKVDNIRLKVEELLEAAKLALPCLPEDREYAEAVHGLELAIREVEAALKKE